MVYCSVIVVENQNFRNFVIISQNYLPVNRLGICSKIFFLNIHIYINMSFILFMSYLFRINVHFCKRVDSNQNVSYKGLKD